MLSIYEEGWREAERHKWIESQKYGCDVGVAALDDWYRKYWNIFCRCKCLEHLEGMRIWREFEPTDFGLISELIEQEDLLLELILDRAYDGYENLNLIDWAFEWGLPIGRVIGILEQLNLNRAQQLPHDAPPQFAAIRPI